MGADQRLARQHVDREAHRVRSLLHRALVLALRPGHPAADAVARLPQPQRVLSGRALAAARAPLLVALVIGFAVSISLAQIVLTVLVVWVLLARRAAVLGLVQVVACPGPDAVGAATPLVGKFLRKCTRARAFYSIYMTLAGVLAMMLASALPRLARLGGEARWLGPAWLLSGAALGL